MVIEAQRIIHVTNFGFKPVKAYLHNTGVKLSNGWIRGGHHVINFSDRDIAKWRAFLGHRKWGVSVTNQMLLELCRSIKPDVVAFGHADIITAETIAHICAELPDVRMLQWNVDWLVPSELALKGDPTAENNKIKILSKADVLDATFVTTAGSVLEEMSKPKHPVCFMPNPVDLSIERCRNFEKDNLPFDVFFASNSEDDRRYHCGAWHHMDVFCRDMAKSAPDLRLALPGIGGQPKVFGPEYQGLLGQCRIGLNISRRNDQYLYSSDRIAQMIGNGLVICVDRASGYGDIFSDDEMVFYSSEDELFKKLSALKKDDSRRKRIGEAGWKKYSELFNSSVVAQYMLDVVMGHAAALQGISQSRTLSRVAK